MTSTFLTGGFQALLTQSSANNVVQVFNALEVKRQITSQFDLDNYHCLIHLIIESFDISPSIYSLAKAPLPDINDFDTRTEQASKIYANYIAYPKVGIQLLYDDGTGIFRNQGQPILFQNVPIQLPISHLKPYLSATQDVLLIGEKDRIAVQVIPDSTGTYSQLSGNDYILLKGNWKAEVKLIEKKSLPVSNWYPIGIDLIAGQPKVILAPNPRRRILYINNKGVSNVRFFFGHTSFLENDSCPYLLPEGTFNQSESNLVVSSQLVAMSVGGNSRLVGMEGSV